MPIQNLPIELLRDILACIEDKTQLVECRIVCKKWNPIAEKVLLGKPISITTKKAAWCFYRHINKNEHLGHSVRNIQITGCNAYDSDGVYDADDDNPCRKILPLIFTTKLELLDGDMDEMEYYDQMLLIIEQQTPGAKFKLRRIPLPADQESLEYQEVVIHSANTMEEVHLMIAYEIFDNERTFIEKLKDFIFLTTLCMTIERTDFETMDLVTDNCTRLQELDISYTDTRNFAMTTQEVQNWFRRKDIQTNRSLKLLKVDNCFSCILIEYLVYRYSKIEMITVDMRAYKELSITRSQNGFVDTVNQHFRAVEALRNVPMYELTFYTDHGSSLEEIAVHAKNADNNVTETSDPSEQTAQIHVQRVQK